MKYKLKRVSAALGEFEKKIRGALELHWFFAGLFILVLAAVFLWIVPKWQVSALSAQGVSPSTVLEVENHARVTLAQILGGLFILLGLAFTWRRIEVARESQITHRFTQAIDQLGSEKLEVRLGGIYALERIASDSTKDRWPIVEILTASVREHAAWTENRASETTDSSDEKRDRIRPATDVQAILTVLGRMSLIYEKDSKKRMDLSRTNLQAAISNGANFERVNLRHANLEEATFRRAKLRAADLTEARLSRCDFHQADLHGADLINAQAVCASFARADMRGADMGGANLEKAVLGAARLQGSMLAGANLTMANFAGAHLEGANLQLAKGLTRQQVDSAVIDGKTKLPTYLE